MINHFPGRGIRRALRALAWCAALAAATATADVLKIPLSQQAAELADLPRPVHGQTATAVEATWGQPLSRRGPVGEPPISAWEYDHFTVYFERDLVLHSVLRHTPVAMPEADEPATPAP